MSHAQSKYLVVDDKYNPVSYANIFFPNINKGTITNSTGLFMLPENYDPLITISHIGFQIKSINLDTILSNTIVLSEREITLNEVKITPNRGKEILMRAIDKIPVNYSNQEKNQRAFYREYLYEHKNLKTVSESNILVIKAPYTNKIPDKLFIESVNLYSHDSTNTEMINGPIALFNQCDVVKNKSYILNKRALDNHHFLIQSVMPFSDHIAYHIRFVPIKKKRFLSGGDRYSGEIYIDTTDYALLSLNLNRLPPKGHQNENTMQVNYQKLENSYLLSNARKQVTSGHKKAELIMAITDFNISSKLKPEAPRIEKGVPLKEYLKPEYPTGLTILPDSIKINRNTKNPACSAYAPIFEIQISTDLLNRTDIMSNNFNSLSSISNYFLSNSIDNAMVWSFAQTLLQYAFLNPFSMVVAESALLNKNRIDHKIVPFIFNQTLTSHCMVNNPNNLQSLYEHNRFDFIRTGTVRNELLFNSIGNIEDHLFEKNYCIEGFSNVFYIDLFTKRSTLFMNQLLTGQEYFDIGKSSDRNLNTIYYLTENSEGYNEQITKQNLSESGQNMMIRTKWFSLLNLISPFILGKQNIDLSNDVKMNFSLGYLLTPVGEAYIQNYWLKKSKNSYKLSLVFLYANQKIGYYAELDLIQRNVTSRIGLKTKLIAHNTTSYLPIYSINNHVGLGFEQELTYVLSSKCELLIGCYAKNQGYTPTNLSTNEGIHFKTGVSWKF